MAPRGAYVGCGIGLAPSGTRDAWGVGATRGIQRVKPDMRPKKAKGTEEAVPGCRLWGRDEVAREIRLVHR